MAVLEEIHGRYRREERLQRLVPPLEACLEVWRREQRLGLQAQVQTLQERIHALSYQNGSLCGRLDRLCPQHGRMTRRRHDAGEPL
jgi:hypothetical protein